MYLFNYNVFIEIFNLDNSGKKQASELLSYIPAIIFAYLSGHILSIGSSALIEKYLEYSNGYPSAFLFDVTPPDFFTSKTKWGNFGRFVLWLMIIPISINDLVLRKVLGIKIFNQAKSLPLPLRKAVFSKCKSVLAEEIEVDTSKLNIEKGVDGDYFRLLYHFAFEHFEKHSNKLQNYVALYGLTRNIALVLTISFWSSLIINFTCVANVNYLQPIILAFCAYIFYIGFVKFYRRFTLEAVMAASVHIKNGAKQDMVYGSKLPGTS